MISDILGGGTVDILLIAVDYYIILLPSAK